jgi:hypothetical protein
MTTLILSKNVVRAALFFHVHAFRSSGYWSAVWSPKMSRFMVVAVKVCRNYLEAKSLGTGTKKGKIVTRKDSGESDWNVPLSNEGTELRTKVLVFVVAVESSEEVQVDIAAGSDPRYWRRKFGNDRSWGVGSTLYL